MPELPIVKELSSVPTIPAALSQFDGTDGIVLFESARADERLARYSFLAAAPFYVSQTSTPEFGKNPFQAVEDLAKEYPAKTVSGLPPFQGGFAGLLSYDLGRCWEKLPTPKFDEFKIPACVIGIYDWLIAWDHLQGKCWVLAHGFPEVTNQRRYSQAQETVEGIISQLKRIPSDHKTSDKQTAQPVHLHAERYPFPESSELRSNFSEAGYLAAVQKVIDYIYEGDIFQANLSQRFTSTTNFSPLDVYLSLRKHNPAPFAGYMKFADWAVLSSSPERFIQQSGNKIWTRPIKGTRQRRPIPEADLYSRDELRESQKDQAENVMIVDLMRNDLSKVCLPETIRVPELCTIEAYETVTHLVSEVTGELSPGATFWDVIRATFPGGSITGAPKIRAMEIITELEKVSRGPYCGSMFYMGFDGTADSNILIRTIVQRGENLYFPAGGGIVSQSNPKSEYEETLHKSAGMREALRRLKVQ